MQASLDRYRGRTEDKETTTLEKMILVVHCTKIMEVGFKGLLNERWKKVYSEQGIWQRKLSCHILSILLCIYLSAYVYLVLAHRIIVVSNFPFSLLGTFALVLLRMSHSTMLSMFLVIPTLLRPSEDMLTLSCTGNLLMHWVCVHNGS